MAKRERKLSGRRLREAIAREAAHLLRDGNEADYLPAKKKAARRLGRPFRPRELPSNHEIVNELRDLSDLVEPVEPLPDDGRAAARALLRIMTALSRFEPIVAVEPTVPLKDWPRNRIPSIHVRAESADSVITSLRREDVRWSTRERHADTVSLALTEPVATTLVIHPLPDHVHSGGWTIDQLTDQLRNGATTGEPVHANGLDGGADRFDVLRDLLAALEEVSQDPAHHPEGDALYHSLQVFDLAVAERPYDEEWLTAALTHDIGKLVDSRDHVEEGLRLLRGLITHRSARLIRLEGLATRYLERQLTAAERQAFDDSPDREDALELHQLDLRGRRSGAATRSLDDAIEYLRELDADSHHEVTRD